MKPACLDNTRLLLVVFLLLSLACSSPQTEKVAVDRSKFTDEQKRLPENAASAFKVADGLDVALFASEPMMMNPTNMDIDARGRIWVTEGYNYRFNLNPGHPHKDAGDRILILEDTNGDGKADTSKVFYQDSSINAALGIAVLGNKVIVSCSPNVFVLTDTNGDDKADKKETLFSGIGGVQHDHAIHAFTFGPDGKLYFNFGNAGDSIMDRNGQVIRDLEGIAVNGKGKPYRQGMIFRCDLDGSHFEVLANNFRNNYEVAVDAYGNMWQSDNDDDGNRGVRINYILEYGNYGYTDEMTGAGWQARRINLEDSIPLQHWHLNDPGVVPNLLQTGSGSPTGMLIYDGKLLPERFRGQMIHAEPGHNVVRSYPVKKQGAGYSATIDNILEATDDNWFRPADVCVAPDGSLFVADWYDPGVGGHQVGDLERGRVFRVAPDVSTYKIPAFSTDNVVDAITALENPNLATRYLAWQKLHETGAEKSLSELFEGDGEPVFRARAFWLLVNLPGRAKIYIDKALADKNEDIRTAAFKAAREKKVDVIPMVEKVMHDASFAVKREALIALHHNSSPQAPALWAKLAQQYDGKDRWYLEALGISADKQWDRFFDAWQKAAGSNLSSDAAKDIIWRARTPAALQMVAKIIKDPATDPTKNLRYFRAFDFYADSLKQPVLLSLLSGDHPNQKFITVYALTQMDTSTLVLTPALKKTIHSSLEVVKGSQAFLDLVAKFKIKDQNPELLAIAINNPKKETRSLAVKLLIENNGSGGLLAAVKKDTATAMSLVTAMGNDEDKKTKELLQSLMLDKSLDLTVRKKATQMLHTGWRGQAQLMALVADHKISPELDTMAKNVLLKSWRQDVKLKAFAFYNQGGPVQPALPAVVDLVKLTGNESSGRSLFTGNCSICHQVNNSGTNFGPDLSEIGAKLSKEALYDAVLHPDAGISFGYDGFLIKQKDGNQLLGYITSETKEELAIKSIGGTTTKIKKSDIVSQKPYGHSLMPTGLLNGLQKQQVVDLIEYLSTLKKGSVAGR